MDAIPRPFGGHEEHRGQHASWDERAARELGFASTSEAYRLKGCGNLSVVRHYQEGDSTTAEDRNVTMNVPASRVFHCQEVLAHGPVLLARDLYR